MTNNNWKEEFNDTFYKEVDSFIGTSFGDSKLDAKLKDFIKKLFTQKDQEHKAELDKIKREIEYIMGEHTEFEEVKIYKLGLKDAISIIDNHINKLSI